MNYADMSVHDLVLLASHDGAMQQHFKKKIPSDLPAIESALRDAVIREASAKSTKKRKKRVNGMSQSEWDHWQNDSYPN